MPRPGLYALVLEYASEVDNVQNVNILIGGQSEGQILARTNIYSCAFRSVAFTAKAYFDEMIIFIVSKNVTTRGGQFSVLIWAVCSSVQHAVPERGGERHQPSGEAAAFSQGGDYSAHFHSITSSGEEDAPGNI